MGCCSAGPGDRSGGADPPADGDRSDAGSGGRAGGGGRVIEGLQIGVGVAGGEILLVVLRHDFLLS